MFVLQAQATIEKSYYKRYVVIIIIRIGRLWKLPNIFKLKELSLCQNSNFLFLFLPNAVDLRYFKLWILCTNNLRLKYQRFLQSSSKVCDEDSIPLLYWLQPCNWKIGLKIVLNVLKCSTLILSGFQALVPRQDCNECFCSELISNEKDGKNGNDGENGKDGKIGKDGKNRKDGKEIFRTGTVLNHWFKVKNA